MTRHPAGWAATGDPRPATGAGRAPADRGSAVLWTLWAVVLVTVTCLLVLGWATAVVTRQRAENAADLAALAAARALVAGGVPCSAGTRVAAATGARLVGCAVSGESVTVVVEIAVPSRALLGVDVPPARARARAGVPP